MTTSTGDSRSHYGFTGERTDPSGLTYLRARYYNPTDGRFMNRDTWSGDVNNPHSLNRWMYVEGNPVNYVDPTGHYGEMVDWCQMMPTKGMYESCVLMKYGLEPISYFELGQRVQGEIGCYSGPSAYRAPGYLEGLEFHGGGIPSITGGFEVVYDFATMERSAFSFWGITLNDGLIGGGSSVYFGKVLGFPSDGDIINDYRDVSFTGAVGLSFDVGIGGAIGRGGFISGAANSIPFIRGKTWYIGGSISGDLLPLLDASVAAVTYSPSSNLSISYILDNGEIDTGGLFDDILYGAESPWLSAENNIALFVSQSAIRTYGLFLAARYAMAYTALRYEK